MKTLRPKKYKEEEFFIADEVREYKNNNISVLVRSATGIGLATVFDKDLWIYAISKWQQVIFEGKRIKR
ncbi:replication initiator protein A [Providencia alcalifaciens]|uniref:Uncharacterized protein n=1 Tax=Providencia alcalifaciens TaxID=126385 RepID=H7C8G9_9GAMM|nr:hypothetical protein [Providencia alcalifaciens]